MNSRDKLVIIMGPTASGKSALALEIAERCNGEIVSADSMQFYRELNIGVAKPSDAEKALIPHHLIDCCSMSERVDVWFFLHRAHAAIKDIFSRGKLPILAGGSGMYIKALLYGLDDLPGDRELRTKLDEQYDSDEKYPDLLGLMAEKDPLSFAKYSNNRRKLIRSLEVLMLTGKSIVELQQNQLANPVYPCSALALTPKREYLKERITLRCRHMLNSGWLEEAEQLLAAGLLNTPTARQAIGYSIIGEYLAGEINYESMEQRIITVTWQFARRQLTWFRHQHEEAKKISYEKELYFEDVVNFLS